MTCNTPPWQRDVEDLHRFFEAWLRGDVPADDASFAPVEAALAPAFTFVDPGGERRSRADVIDALRAGYGARPELRIRIDDASLHHDAGGLTLASYLERQTDGDRVTTRISTVLFRAEASAPNGVEWLHVHETWHGKPASPA
ncbi:MAG: DUF4440 domain-containing protein [Planctomycetes bacterium]|nr:DUF4440 domain-containing protein [Planctomycetota bacterium]